MPGFCAAYVLGLNVALVGASFGAGVVVARLRSDGRMALLVATMPVTLGVLWSNTVGVFLDVQPGWSSAARLVLIVQHLPSSG